MFEKNKSSPAKNKGKSANVYFSHFSSQQMYDAVVERKIVYLLPLIVNESGWKPVQGGRRGREKFTPPISSHIYYSSFNFMCSSKLGMYTFLSSIRVFSSLHIIIQLWDLFIIYTLYIHFEFSIWVFITFYKLY